MCVWDVEVLDCCCCSAEQVLLIFLAFHVYVTWCDQNLQRKSAHGVHVYTSCFFILVLANSCVSVTLAHYPAVFSGYAK